MSRASIIYVVIAATSHEGSDPVCSFEDKADAEALAEKCRKHEAKCPRCPEVDAPDSEWDAYYATTKKWTATHPARAFFGRESYFVSALPYRARQPKQRGK